MFFFVVALVLGSIQGCVSPSIHMKQLIQKKKFDKAIHYGNEWSKSYRTKKKRPKEWNEVQYLIAWASYKITISRNTISGYKLFQRKFPKQGRIAALHEDANARESILVYQTEVLPSANIKKHQVFRKRYPDSPKFRHSFHQEAKLALRELVQKNNVGGFGPYRERYRHSHWKKKSRLAEIRMVLLQLPQQTDPAKVRALYNHYSKWPETTKQNKDKFRQREIALAAGVAKKVNTIKGWVAFQRQYEKWPEYQLFRQQVKEHVIELDYKKVMFSQSSQLWRDFNKKYKGWKVKPRLRKVAIEREAWMALLEARTRGTPKDFQAFRSTFKSKEWTERAWRFEFFDSISYFIYPSFGATLEKAEMFLSRNSKNPLLPRLKKGKNDQLWAQAKSRKTPFHYRLFYKLFPNSRKAREAKQTEKKLIKARFKSWRFPHFFGHFAKYYPNHKRSAEAEKKYHNLRQKYKLARQWPRVQVQVQRRMPNGMVELVVNVKDCNGKRISGLQRDSFLVFAGAKRLSIRNFRGLNDPAPADIVFALDLSCSMEVERKAIQAAALHFTEALQFRGRDVRTGLITFTDKVLKVFRPRSGAGKLRNWLRSMKQNIGGGDGEDGAHAMLRASSTSFRRRSERILVMMTDEPLQVNVGGLRALGLPRDSGICYQIRRLSLCLNYCRGTARCIKSCINRSSVLRARTSACIKRYRYRNLCYRLLLNSLVRSVRSCRSGGQILQRNSKAMIRLASRLIDKKIRPFFLVPQMIGGFFTLSSLTQGKTLYVPQNATTPAPYIKQLNEIADILSRQYILRVRPPQGWKESQRLEVRARYAHRWSKETVLPAKSFLAMIPTKEEDGCPQLLGITHKQGLFLSKKCGTRWAAIAGNTSKTFWERAWRFQKTVVLQSSEKQLFLWDGKGQKLTPLRTPLSKVYRVTLDTTGVSWILGKASEVWKLYRTPKFHSKAKWVEVPLPKTIPPRLKPLLWRSETLENKKLCFLFSRSFAYCRNTTGGVWEKVRVRGLSYQINRYKTQMYTHPTRPSLLFLSASEGGLFRSINGGLTWRKALPPSSTGHRLLFFGGQSKRLCATTSRQIYCSDSSGAFWQNIGLHFLDKTSPTLAIGKNSLLVAKNRSIYQLYRVSNREAPSSTLYFDTAKDQPKLSITPFLRQVVREMSKKPELSLRIEGHTDYRGGTAYNENLAMRRAKNVAAKIKSMGVQEQRLQIRSFGKRRPIAKGSSSRALARNRRVELILMKPLKVSKWEASVCENKAATLALTKPKKKVIQLIKATWDKVSFSHEKKMRCEYKALHKALSLAFFSSNGQGIHSSLSVSVFRMASIKQAVHATFQINWTFRYRTTFSIRKRNVYEKLVLKSQNCQNWEKVKQKQVIER